MIRGMTTNRQPRPERIATLRKGGEKGSNRPGQDLDHFRLVPVDPKDTALVEAFHAEYGKQPNHIEVYLPHASASENFQAWMEEYSASQLVHRCDGEQVYAYNALGELAPTGERCPYAAGRERTSRNPGCKQVGRLEVIIPALVTQAGRFGIVTVATTSIHDIIGLSQTLEFFERMAGGDLRGTTFVLSRVPREISTPKPDGTRARRPKWLLSLQPASQWVMRQLQAPTQQTLAAPQEQRLLTSVDTDTGEVIDAPSRPARDAERAAAKLQAARERYEKLAEYGRDLDMEPQSLPAEAGYNEVIERGQALVNMIRERAIQIAFDVGQELVLPENASVEDYVEAAIAITTFNSPEAQTVVEMVEEPAF